jgi:RNA polymerase sigma-70 factor (ECF subfamily)
MDALLRAVQEPLFRSIYRLSGDRTLAEDILQEVLIRIYRKLSWLEDPALLWPWSHRIAARETFKRLRRERTWKWSVRDLSVLESTSDPGAERILARVVDSLDEEAIDELLRDVSPASRAVLVLHYVDQLTLAEIGETLGISVGTVKSRLAYGLAHLRRAAREAEERSH